MEPQLLMLQQVLFYRELGFELKQVVEVLRRPDFEKIKALESHRRTLHEGLSRTKVLLDTIGKTIAHLEGTTPMTGADMFIGFSVGAGRDPFDDPGNVGGQSHDCKISARGTNGAVCGFECSGGSGGPRHRHLEQDEWIYILEGEVDVEVGEQRFRARAGETVFLPKAVPHAWAPVGDQPGRILDTYQPAGTIEAFFRVVGSFTDPAFHDALNVHEMAGLFAAHGMELLGPPLVGEWHVDAEGRITRTA